MQATENTEVVPTEADRCDRPVTVTVVMAAYQSRDRILVALDSLRRQTLDSRRFETLIVVNGPDDGVLELLQEEAEKDPAFNMRVVTTPVANASVAWNLGLELAAGDYVTIIDDDDRVSPEYLAALLEDARPDQISIAHFADVSESDPVPKFDNYLNRAIFRHAGATTTFDRLNQASSANCGKLVHRSAVGAVRFDPELRSGMDVAFWSEVIVRGELRLRVLGPMTRAVYYRTIRDDSMSRRMTRQFALDRIRVINHLRQVSASSRRYRASLAELARAQAAHLGSYLRDNPADNDWLRAEIKASRIERFPYASMNERAARTLVVAYAFPPFKDTSAMVMARRLRIQGESFDAVVQDMSNIRDVDDFSESLVRELLGKKFVVPGPATFGGWRHIERFVLSGLEFVERRVAQGKTYERVYSRSMFPASHILAAAIKVRYPDVHWRAEFSDPMRHDSSGVARENLMGQSEVLETIDRAVSARFPVHVAGRNMWPWIEDTCFALADDVLFTNENQRTLMAREAPEHLRPRLLANSTVSPHPTLPENFYHQASADYEVPDDKINLGYFGVFYASRGVGDLLSALSAAPADLRDRFRLHVFTDKPSATASEVASSGLSDCVAVNGFVPYLEFLNLCTRLDGLVVSDALATATHGLNPYLPSKYSDYVGSGTPIIGIVEPGSVLDSLPLAAKMPIGDPVAGIAMLSQIARAGVAVTEGDRLGVLSDGEFHE